jgi:hypothetical protein
VRGSVVIRVFLLFIILLVFFAAMFPSEMTNQIKTLFGFILGFIGTLLVYAVEKEDKEKKQKRMLFDSFVEEIFRNFTHCIYVIGNDDVKDHFELDAWNNLKMSGFIIRTLPEKDVFLKINTYAMTLREINKEIDSYFAYKDYFFQNRNQETERSLDSKRVRLVASIKNENDKIGDILTILQKKLNEKKICKYDIKES